MMAAGLPTIGDFRDELLPGAPGAPFVAIDFETADAQRDSACSVAVVRVEGDAIVATRSSLIRPPRPSSQNTHVHGISEAAQRAAPKLRDFWDQDFAPLFEGVECIVAHNATFDHSVMLASWGIRGMVAPGLPWACSVKMARRLWPKGPGLPDHKLPTLVRYLGLAPLNHHEALSDARACAGIVLAARAHVARPAAPAEAPPAPAPAPVPAPPPLEAGLTEALALVELGRAAYRQTDGVPDIDTLQRSLVDPRARVLVGLAWLAEHLEADLEAAARGQGLRVESRMRSLVSLLCRPWNAPPDFVRLVQAQREAAGQLRHQWGRLTKEERDAHRDRVRDLDDQVEEALALLREVAR